VWLAPDLLLLSAGFLLYNLGITCPFVLFFSLWNRERLAPQRSGFFNYEGLSVQHWIGSLPVFVPPLVLALALNEAWLLAGVSVVGLLGMALGPTWTRAFARLFSKHRHAMGTGFRRGE
jgi:cytochrome c biogenesis protein CcdA